MKGVPRACLLFVLGMALVSCAAPERIEGTGEKVAPPYGWLVFCRDHQDDPSCREQNRT